ncbi:glutathione transport system permease protein GsiD [Treponema primitia ZAS-2]|uniref:Glutathione transport system permease protein GsiD n=1 Tax=Treponema primitia (strain ATCC BAA-887 / DSM 12427 / ZAS-2) TaxID=545694 RepID=F5YHF2_TREPZ|nr:ABC transporter permease [Treponema primitia]AEF84597.1 glutathione transport system permease protein GsiD [Treponema primitia ZAS-2]
MGITLADIREAGLRRKKPLSPALRNTNIVIGGVIVLVMVFIALFPGLVASHDPLAYSADLMLRPPSAEHIFGTDHLGRDIFSRVIWGARIDLMMGVVAVITPFILGTLIGLLAGYYGGFMDSLMMRACDIFMAFPFTLIVIVVVTVTGPSITNLFIAMWLVSWMHYARLVRGEVLVAKNAEYIQAARVLGYTNIRLLLRHLLPNVISGCVVYAASDIVMCMLAGASMSFLGLGIQPPTPEWGAIIEGGRAYISNAWWIAAFPGLFLAVTGTGFSLIGDGLSDLLRTRGRA